VKAGDLVKFKSDSMSTGMITGIIVAELPADSILAAAVSVSWSNGEFTERVTRRILEVIR
jgi:hypothetical protein